MRRDDLLLVPMFIAALIVAFMINQFRTNQPVDVIAVVFALLFMLLTFVIIYTWKRRESE